MAYHYIFDPIAADEYEEAFKWYEQRSLVAADNLIVAVQEAIIAICTDPYRYRNTYKKVRELNLKKYPYALIYFMMKINNSSQSSPCFIINVILNANTES